MSKENEEKMEIALSFIIENKIVHREYRKKKKLFSDYILYTCVYLCASIVICVYKKM